MQDKALMIVMEYAEGGTVFEYVAYLTEQYVLRLPVFHKDGGEQGLCACAQRCSISCH